MTQTDKNPTGEHDRRTGGPIITLQVKLKVPNGLFVIEQGLQHEYDVEGLESVREL